MQAALSPLGRATKLPPLTRDKPNQGTQSQKPKADLKQMAFQRQSRRRTPRFLTNIHPSKTSTRAGHTPTHTNTRTYTTDKINRESIILSNRRKRSGGTYLRQTGHDHRREYRPTHTRIRDTWELAQTMTTRHNQKARRLYVVGG